jgi:DNA-binding phage protein
MDHETLASELIRALRGRRSQTAFSRRLGFRSNVVYSWESGRAWPTAAAFLKAAERCGCDLSQALPRFHQIPAESSPAPELASPAYVARLLDSLRGGTSVVDLARAVGCSRFALARWLKGQTEPRLPDFLRVIDAASLRLLDFIACFADPGCLPSVGSQWRKLEKARLAAYDVPWSHAVLRVIELESYRALPRHRPGFIAEWLGIGLEEEQRCIELLLDTGQIEKRRGRLVPGAASTVDTRQDKERSRRLRAWWIDLSKERLLRGDEGSFSFNLMSVSRADLERIRELYGTFFREVRRIVADSNPMECIAVMNTQIVELRAREPAAAERGAGAGR